MKKNPNDTLMPFQKKGVRWITHFKGRALLADEMGLGKTRQVLRWLYENSDVRPVVIICPAFLKYVWASEASSLYNMRTEVIEGRKSEYYRPFVSRNIMIINYEILQYWQKYIETMDPKILILDEVHYIQNPRAKRTKVIKRMTKTIPHLIGVSGTPLTNRPIELFNFLNMVRPDIFPSRFSFAMRYCRPRKTRWGWDFTGATHTKELHGILNKYCMIRRKKSDVLKDLPQKMRSIVPLPIDNKKEYKEACDNFIKWLSQFSIEKAKKAAKAEQLVQMGYLKRLAAELKIKYTLDWISTFLKQEKGKLVIFGIHKKIIGSIYKEYKNISVKVDGTTSSKKRKHLIDQFQNNKKTRLFIGNITAAGVGITLTASSSLVFVELDWVPGKHTQAEDRIHRIGQKKTAFIYYLVAKNTIEEHLCQLLEKKQKVLDNVLDGGSGGNELDIFTQLKKKIERG